MIKTQTVFINGQEELNQNILHPELPEVRARIESALVPKSHKRKTKQININSVREGAKMVMLGARHAIRRFRSTVAEAHEVKNELLLVHQMAGLIRAEVEPTIQANREAWEGHNMRENHGYAQRSNMGKYFDNTGYSMGTNPN